VIAMPPRSKILQLPSEVKTWLDRALADNNFSEYESLANELKERGFAISKSALNRYGQDFEQRLAALKMASEQAKAIVDAAPDEEGAVSDALMRLVQERLFNLLLAEDGKVDLPKAAKAIAELAKATIAQKKFSIEQNARKKLLAEQEGRLDEELRGADGMSEELENRIRGILLGKS
jgi:HPt (histidine-containing phosphotransfer) domain-containing protein